MNYWLLKSDPKTYSWAALLKEKTTRWDGVRNYAARNHLRAIKKGDLALFYHSSELVITGIAEIVKEHYVDPTASEDIWSAVDIKAHKTFKTPVTLEQIKSDKRLKNMLLLKIGRLSVMPVTGNEFHIIVKAGS